jgi:quinohemoprotein ethanol dehydrogenase
MVSRECTTYRCRTAVLALGLLLTACAPSAPQVVAPAATGNVTAARLAAADSQPENWFTAGRDAGRTHHSPLRSMHEGNVDQLGVAWNYATGTKRGMEATPIVVDGVMYTSGVAGRVYVLDAATGNEIWKFEPKIDMQVNRWSCCDAVNHGVAVWQGRVYVAAFDGVLYSLEATTGKVLWSVDTIVNRQRGYSSVGAPEVAGNVVVIGNAGGEYDASGYVSAYDINNGTLRWRSYLVPTGDPAIDTSPDIRAAAKTWDPNSRWDIGGGGNAWDAILYDPEFNLVYVGTGNGEPHSAYTRSPRGGDNLYLSSIVAFHADTGRVAWHVQQAPGDSWDFDSTQPMMLTQLLIGGRERKVLLQAPKTGFFYVIERPSGKVLSASPYVPVTWARVDLATGRVLVNQDIANYSRQPALIFPSGQGGHNWNRMSFNPSSGIAFVPTILLGEYFIQPAGEWQYRPRGRNVVTRSIFSGSLDALLPTFPQAVQKQLLALKNRPGQPDTSARAMLRAIEPLSGRTLWEVEAAGGAWDHAGVLSTDGNLVFQGTGTGHMRVFRATDGKLLKDIDVGTSIIAAPMTYAINGEQYVAVLAGYGGARWYYYEDSSAARRYGNANRIIAFKLGGTAVAKPVTQLPPAAPIPEPPTQSVDAAIIEQGRSLFGQYCTSCHGDVYPTGSADLRRMSRPVHDSFGDIVLSGQRLPLGMPRFDDLLTPAQADAIHAYLIDHAWKAYRAEQSRQAPPAPLATGAPH